MHVKTACSIGVLLSAWSLAGCDLAKSRNPLSPSVAGPIEGVTISAPRPIEPAAGARLTTGVTAVALVVENASTSGARPLSYDFEVSTSAAFDGPVIRSSVAPGGDGRTRYSLSLPFSGGQVFHWRARAVDGANVGPYSDAMSFLIVDPVVLGPPMPVSPIDAGRLGALPAALRVSHAARSGPVGAITYRFDVSETAGFEHLIWSAEVAEQPGSSTEVVVDATLALARAYYWRARASEPQVEGPWSGTAVFQTPLAPVVVPPPAPLPPPSGQGLPGVSEGVAMVAFVIADLRARGISIAGDCGAFEITRRVALAFRDRGAGLEYKPGGRRCQDHSIDIVLFNDGRSVDILIGAGEDNGPAWQVHDPYAGWQAFWRVPF